VSTLTRSGQGRYTVGVNEDDAVPGEVLKTDERTRRILDAAVQLAEAGGFAAVRLRDVAQTSGVALGTVYKRFRSKEDLLLGVLTHELHDLRAQLAEQPVLGPTPLLRVIGFFRFLTEFLCRRPNLGRAVVRSAASGEQALSERLARFHAKLFELSFAAWQGGPHRAPTPGESVMLSALQQVWFSALCGWAGSLYDRAEVANQVAAAAGLMTHGVDHMPAELAPAARPLRVLVRAAEASQLAALGDPRMQLGEATVELVAADPALGLRELLAQADVVHVVGPIDPAAWELALEEPPPSGGRPRVVVLAGGFAAEVAERWTQHVDVVLGCDASLSAEQTRTFAEKLYLALARGWSLQDAHDDAREALAGVGGIGIAARVGADLRALSLR
jgi:TetR/AcrR family transcriptional regulator, cholesterol catabolism regulator